MSKLSVAIKSNKTQPFIKWAGNKYRLLKIILSKLPKAKILVEPFVGAGAVFLNTEYEYYILNDANRDLINLYQHLQKYGEEFIKFCRSYFKASYNNEIKYYGFREQFNHLNSNKELITRAALFLYLNKHGYNGLCRFNQNNKFNVPFGKNNKVNFPENLMKIFSIKSNRAKFLVKDFQDTFRQCIDQPKHMVIYCDPPYVPLSETANFVAYQSSGFALAQQQILVELAACSAKVGNPVLISNHFTSTTKELYRSANELTTFQIRRMISCKANCRNYVTEVLALYNN